MEAVELCREADRKATEHAQAGDREAAMQTLHEHVVDEPDHPGFLPHRTLAEAIRIVATREEPAPTGHAANLIVPFVEDTLVSGLLTVAAASNDRS